MLDTVWITLTSVDKQENKYVESDETFMFGPTGIVRFKREGEYTVLFNSSNTVVASVIQDPEFIMDILRKIRGTERRLDGKENKKAKANSRKTPTRKKKS